MGEQIFFLVDLIKNRINQNFQAIKENEEVIKNILLQTNVENRSEIISKSNNINQKLREENNELIRIQIELVNKLNKFKEVATYLLDKLSDLSSNNDPENLSVSIEKLQKYNILLDDSNYSDDNLFNQTIKGELVFESNHPKFNDSAFFERLFNYYRDTEYYEMCNYLLRLKGEK